VWIGDDLPPRTSHMKEILILFVASSMVFYLGIYGSRFMHSVAPEALEEWAQMRGYKIVRRVELGLFERTSRRVSGTQVLYRVALRDAEGKTRSGVAKVGDPFWFCLEADQCEVDFRWD
jgi:hypothetical protein